MSDFLPAVTKLNGLPSCGSNSHVPDINFLEFLACALYVLFQQQAIVAESEFEKHVCKASTATA